MSLLVCEYNFSMDRWRKVIEIFDVGVKLMFKWRGEFVEVKSLFLLKDVAHLFFSNSNIRIWYWLIDNHYDKLLELRAITFSDLYYLYLLWCWKKVRANLSLNKIGSLKIYWKNLVSLLLKMLTSAITTRKFQNFSRWIILIQRKNRIFCKKVFRIFACHRFYMSTLWSQPLVKLSLELCCHLPSMKTDPLR